MPPQSYKLTRYYFSKDKRAAEHFDEDYGRPKTDKDGKKVKMKDLFQRGLSTGARG